MCNCCGCDYCVENYEQYEDKFRIVGSREPYKEVLVTYYICEKDGHAIGEEEDGQGIDFYAGCSEECPLYERDD